MENEEKLTRTKLHEMAMISIYQYLFYKSYAKSMNYRKPANEIVSDVMETSFDDCDEFYKTIVFEAVKDRDTLIEIIQSKLVRWKFDRLNLTDQAILLLFASEILNKREEVQVSIDMALDLAHRYCADNSFKYINKVLDRISKENA